MEKGGGKSKKAQEVFVIKKGKSGKIFLCNLLTQRLLLTNQQSPRVWLDETHSLYLTARTCVALGQSEEGSVCCELESWRRQESTSSTLGLLMAGETPTSDCSPLIDHSHVPEFEVALWVKITLALIYICIFVAGLLGNSITIKVTRILQRKGYLQKEVTDHMVSLACSDLLVILLGMPVERCV